MIENVTWLILCVYFEARNQDLKTKVAVGHVVLNRTVKRQKSIGAVVTQPKQFSWYAGTVPPVKDMEAYDECKRAVKICFSQRNDGRFFFGADHFYDDSIKEPYWAKSMSVVGKVGAFYFFKS